MKAGKVGVLVLMVSLMGMLGVSWVMSMDVVMTEKTTYTEVTEITPLFGSQQMPQYTDYSPSTNYTGYWTDATVIDGKTYFGGVDFDKAERANNYRLNLPPESSIPTASYDLTDATSSADWTVRAEYWPTNDNRDIVSNISYLSFDDLVSELSLSSYTYVTVANATEPSDWSTAGSFITFAVVSDFSDYLGNKLIKLKNPNLTGELRDLNTTVPPALNPAIPASTVTDVALAAVYDYSTGYVQLYRDLAMTDSVGIYAPSQVLILWGGTPAQILDLFTFGSDIEYTAAQIPEITYMDPSKGVELA